MRNHPAPPARRRRYETGIRVIDLLVYLVVLLGGSYALIGRPNIILDGLGEHAWLAVIWAALLIGGGLVGFLGRLFRYWLVETPAVVAVAFGILICVVVLWPYIFTNVAVGVITALAVVALGFAVRRWMELQIFATEPNEHLSRRLQAAMARRTEDVVPRTY